MCQSSKSYGIRCDAGGCESCRRLSDERTMHEVVFPVDHIRSSESIALC